MAPVTPVTFWVSSSVPRAAICTLPEISCVADPCSSTATAICEVKPSISVMVEEIIFIESMTLPIES